MIYHYNNFGQLDQAQIATYNSANNSMVAGNQNDIQNSYNEKGQLISIETNTATYEYFYDVFGNTQEIRVDGQLLAEYVYAANNGKLIQESCGNQTIAYVYDGVDRIIGICYNGSQSATFTYSYNANGQISEHKDLKNGMAYSHEYDGSNKLIQTTVKSISDNKVSYTVKNTYDDQGRLSSVFSYYTDTKAAPLSYTEYSYDDAGNLTVINLGGTTASLYYSFDEFGRLVGKNCAKTYGSQSYISQTYNYETHNGNYSSGQISSTVLTDSTGQTTTEYQYDANGNITSVIQRQGSTIVSERSYEYDAKGQLIRENIKTNPSSTSTSYNYMGVAISVF